MTPKFVTPYRMSGKRGKNDATDAAAICEAVTRPNMRFVSVKEEHRRSFSVCTVPGKALSKNVLLATTA